MKADIRPILSALLRNRTGAVLVALQIAITLGLAVNAVYIAKQRLVKIHQPTGTDLDNIFVVSSAGFTDHFNYAASVQEDLGYLRSLGQVVAATVMNSVPLSGSGSGMSLGASPFGRRNVQLTDFIEMDEQGLDALGLHLAAGRPFRRADVLLPRSFADSPEAPTLIVTRKWATRIFPGGKALGSEVYYSDGHSARIVGIVDHFEGAGTAGTGESGMVALAPERPFVANGSSYYYVVRTAPGRRDAVMRLAEDHLSSSNLDRVIESVRPLTYFQKRINAADTALAVVLAVVTALLLAVSALGAFGLASYNVSTRTRQIGVRRALGGRRRDIVRYFMVENGLVTGAGVLLGSALALGIGYWLSAENHLPRLDLYYLVGGILILWAIGQLAAWYPARRAAAVPPMVATRTV